MIMVLSGQAINRSPISTFFRSSPPAGSPMNISPPPQQKPCQVAANYTNFVNYFLMDGNKIPSGKPLGISFSRGIGLGFNTPHPHALLLFVPLQAAGY